MIASEVKRNRLQSLLRTTRMLLRMSRNREDTAKSEILYYKMLEKYFTRILTAREEKGFVAAHPVFFPVEILYAMDIVPVHNEVVTNTAALLLDDQRELLAAGAEAGLAPEICSPHRALAGTYFRGDLPQVDAVLWSNLICDNTSKCGEYLMEINHCPGYFLDHPFGDSKIEKDYLVQELKDMVLFLEEKSGHKMDWDRLSQGIVEIDKQIKLQAEICEIRKSVPSPFPAKRFLEFLTVDYMFAGQPEETEYLRTLLDELTEMVRQGKGAVNPERFRLMTLFVPPIYLIPALDKIFQEFGAVSATEPLFTYWKYKPLDPSRPLESVVEKSYMIPETRTMYGPLGRSTLQDIVDCARNYQINGCIYYAFMGCRHTCATIKIIKDTLVEMDIPVLTLDCDIIDPSINSETEVRQKLEQFFELLEDR
jgi:benzoyl-CoA reductase/2-hydroxyglutaryl-CoA dehydratase subunit BcrC/BadD/HgdB